MTAHEAFPPLMCRGCGKSGLSIENARTHKAHTIRDEKGMTRKPSCRGGKAMFRDRKCALCGEEFHEMKENLATGKMRKVYWRGRRIYDHKFQHITNGDKSEDFE